jgi:calcineurin-like phosphoesterase family protein
VSRVWLISDTHFGHSSLIKNFRNFETINDHDEWLISVWNAKVYKRDTVIHLGDITLNYKLLDDIMPKLNGTKHLVMGNHDKGPIAFYLKYFAKISATRRYKGYLLSHWPVHPQELSYRVNKNIHGHIHHVDRCLDPTMYFNVALDVLMSKNGTPLIDFDDLVKEFPL